MSTRTSPIAHRWLIRASVALPIFLGGAFLLARQFSPTYASQLTQLVVATVTPEAPQASQLLFVNSSQPSLMRVSNAVLPDLLVGQAALAEVGSREQMPIIPTGCEAIGTHAAPRGLWVVVELACVHGEASALQLVHTHTGEVKGLGRAFGSQVIFLGWTPNGQHAILLKDALSDAGAVLVSVADGAVTPLNLPSDTYNVALSHDGKHLIYSLTRGLGFGSETWLANIDGSQPQLVSRDPQHIITYVRFSPNDHQLTFIKMPDSNIPFTVGELWVINTDGSNAVLFGPADAGHGYAPAWSPDGKQIAYVYRENAENIIADQVANNLASNLRLADVETGEVQAVTSFTDTLVEAPVWSPDGLRVAFAARPGGGVSDVWVYAPNAVESSLTQATQNADVRYPVFTSDR